MSINQYGFYTVLGHDTQTHKHINTNTWHADCKTVHVQCLWFLSRKTTKLAKPSPCRICGLHTPRLLLTFSKTYVACSYTNTEICNNIRRTEQVGLQRFPKLVVRCTWKIFQVIRPPSSRSRSFVYEQIHKWFTWKNNSIIFVLKLKRV